MNRQPVRPRPAAAGVAIVVLALVYGSAEKHSIAAEPTAIAWRDDYASALEESRATNRPLWVQFTGPWCPNCTRMEQDSFPDPAITAHAQSSFVPLKLRGDVDEQLAGAFNIRGLPATIVVAPDRQILATHEGYLAPAELDALLRDALALQASRSEPAGEHVAAMTGSSASTAKSDAPGNSPPALSGYCPVSLVRARKLVMGQPQFAVTHQGRVYHLASNEMVEHFRHGPERYVPANDGTCPVEQAEQRTAKPGNPRWGVLYRDRLYVFATNENRQLFFRDPDRYAVAGRVSPSTDARTE
jgi:YHS domain-containing protein